MPRGSHAPTLITRARAAIVDERLIADGDVVLVAVSGGRDSMALLDVLARLRAEPPRFELVAHAVDHGLRAEASAELDLAARAAAELGVRFARTRVDVARGSNVQARARTARWGALESAARAAGATSIATAHHADDRAETVLMRLLRGAGARGLAVLPPRDRDPARIARIRPLIRARRADVDAHVARHRIGYADDPSNVDMTYLRARVRHELLPVLGALSPRIVEHLCALADDLGRAAAHGPDGPLDASASRTYTLPRRTALALAQLRDTRNPRARIELPGGITAMLATDEVTSHVHRRRPKA